MPIGTGTFFVVRNTDPQSWRGRDKTSKKLYKGELKQLSKMDLSEGVLKTERAGLNITQRQESLVVQYLALGGHRHWTAPVNRTGNMIPRMACSGVHAGPGQLSFGHDRRHRADLTLFFERVPEQQKPARVFVHNYHEHRVHYKGHNEGCPKVSDPFYLDSETQKADHFKIGLAKIWSQVRPNNVIFEYSVSTACDFFHGKIIRGAATNSISNCCLVELLKAEFKCDPGEEDECRIFLPPPRPDRIGENLLSVAQLKKDILSGLETGFVTIKGGSEAVFNDASDNFGFCVQSYACCQPTDISKFTQEQIARDHGWSDNIEERAELLKSYMSRQPPRTLNSTSFHAEETISTSYLQWLIKERGFCNFEITHFLRYKFVCYWNSYLMPLLQKRHEQKKRGDVVASTINKLIQNSHYGRQGMESSNYDQTLLVTGTTLSRQRQTKLGHLSGKRLVLLGLIRQEIKPTKLQKRKMTAGPIQSKTKVKKRRLNISDFIDHEARDVEDDDPDSNDDAEDKGEEEEEEEDRDLAFSLPKESVELVEPFSDSDWDSSSSSSSSEANEGLEDGDISEMLVRTNETIHNNVGKRKKRYEYHFLYACTFSGKEKRILNNLPGAVAVLSNSKKIFLGHINIMLRCVDPRLAELCYIDTDSCIFSMTYATWEECLKPEFMDLWRSSNVMADEEGLASCHGQMKCEGVYGGGLFKTLKIYRLYDKKEPYTRCKGVNRHLAKRLEDAAFDVNDPQKTVLTRTCLRPTSSGQITMLRESRSLAVSYNFKRKVTNDGIHSFPISFTDQK